MPRRKHHSAVAQEVRNGCEEPPEESRRLCFPTGSSLLNLAVTAVVVAWVS